MIPKIKKKRYGKLVVKEWIAPKRFLCKCDCGNEKVINADGLYNGNITSCGCLRSIKRKDYDKEFKEKMLNKIKISEKGCWEWQRALHKQGYGSLNYKYKPVLAHRIFWELTNGKIPFGLKVCHHCDNPKCINPDHLFLGTQKDNMQDAFQKGRWKHVRYYMKALQNQE